MPEFLSAQHFHRLYPTTFEVPSAERLGAIGPGSLVKLCVRIAGDQGEPGAERFWVEVLERRGDRLVGRVDNDLGWTRYHGLALDDRVAFSIEHIYDVYEDRA